MKWPWSKPKLLCPVHFKPIGKRNMCPICGPRWRT